MNNRPLDIGRTSVNRYMAVRFPVRVLAVRGKTLVLERPLPFDVRPEFFPELLPQSGSVHDVGLEGLRFLFPYAPYGGHHYEAGYNMIQFWEVYNCWVRDVHGHNVDNGIFVRLRASRRAGRRTWRAVASSCAPLPIFMWHSPLFTPPSPGAQEQRGADQRAAHHGDAVPQPQA
jgi:hypothetical protein